MKKGLFFCVLLALSMPAAAQQVQRCVQPDGSVVFTQGGCASGPVESIIINAPPVSDTPHIPRQPPSYPQQRSSQGSRVTVVGGTSDCPVIMSDTAARRQGYVEEGMSREQVMAIYGRPDRTSASSGGFNNMTWYSTDTRPYRSVDFDRWGCVTRVFATQRHNYQEDNRRRQPGTRANTIRR